MSGVLEHGPLMSCNGIGGSRIIERISPREEDCDLEDSGLRMDSENVDFSGGGGGRGGGAWRWRQ